MAEKSINEILAEYDAATKEAPAKEAGAGHYLARGALQGISALADLLPNLYGLSKAYIGAGPVPYVASAVTGRPKSEFMPSPSEANPVANFLLRGYGLDQPVVPSPSIGGQLGAAVLEGAGAAVSQGPMALTRAAPLQMLKSLGTQEARNAVLGGLAGGGAELGAEATGGNPLGALAGGLIGGVALPSSFIRKGGLVVGGTRAAMDTAKDLAGRANEVSGRVEPAFSNYVQGTIRGAVAGTPQAAENITSGLALREKIPGFNPSVAEMANAPGMIDMQKKFALLNPKNLNAEVARNEANTQAVQKYYRSNVPEPSAPGSVRSAINQSLADYDRILQEQAQGVANKLPVADQLSLGEKVAEAAKVEKNAARPGISAAYNKAFEAAGKSEVPSAGIVAAVENVLGEPLTQIKPSNAPQTVTALRRILGSKEGELIGRSIPPDLMDLAAGGKKNLSLQDLHDIRVAINQDVASASRSMDPTAATRLYNLNKVLPEVDAAIGNMPKEAQSAYAAATNKYRTEYAPRFKEGTNLRIFKDTSTNEPRILPDRLIPEYFKTDTQGGVTKAVQFGKLFAANPEAKDAANTGILDIYRQRVVNPSTGAIDVDAHNQFMRDYGRTLNAFKATGVNTLDNIKNIGIEASKAQSAISEFRALANTLKFDSVDELTSSALRNPKTMGNIVTRLSPEKKAIFNSMLLDKSFESGTAAGMTKFLEDNRNTLRITVPEKQLSAMKDIAAALEMTERAPIRGNLAAGGADMLKNSTGVSTATVFSQIRAVTGQRSSVEWSAINLAMPALNRLTQTSFANVMESALHNPESAVALRNYLLAESPQVANAWASKLLNSMKTGGKLVWQAKGPIVSNFVGPERYPGNLAVTGSAIRSQLEQPQGPQ